MATEVLNLNLQRIIRLLPGYDPFAQAGECWFDEDAAQLAIDFFSEMLRHMEGALAGAPFTLEPWQQSIVANLFGWKRKDELGRTVRRYRECLIYVPRKNGKALAVDTPIPTPDGWKAMGDLEAGDTVFDENGLPCRVLEAHPVMFGNRCYRVEFSDGTFIVADAEHLWATKRRRTGRPNSSSGPGIKWPKVQIGTTEEIAQTLYVESPSSAGKNERNHRIVVAEALQCGDADLPIHPYVLGVWLGDGDSDSARITVSIDDTELLSHLAACGCSHNATRRDPRSKALRVRVGSFPAPPCGFRASSQKPCLNKTLRQNGLLNNKHIPAVYLRASVGQRVALLQGLMDTDGYVSTAGQCEFTTTKPKLRDSVLELLRSLGMKPHSFDGRSRCNGKDCGPKYRIQFWPNPSVVPFRLTRKVARLRPSLGRSRTRQIVAVVPVSSVAVRCIKVDSSSRLYLAGKGMVPTHNTPLAAGIGLYCLFCDPERGQQNYIAASTKDQAGLLFRQCRGMVEQEEMLSERCKIFGGNAPGGQSQSIVREEDLSFLRVISSETKVGKHGKNINVAIIDELHEQPDRDLVDTLRTATASTNRPQPLIVYLTTADHARESICNETHNHAIRVRDGVLHDPKFLPVIFEATDADNWKSPDTWKKANPNIGISVSAEYLADECKLAQEFPVRENTFKRLHLNIITEQESVWIPVDKWDACTTVTDPIAWRKATIERLKGAPCDAALDLGSTSDISALALLFTEGDRYTLLPYFWIPGQSARKREERDRVPYTVWIRQGFIATTAGVYDEVTDFDFVRRDINNLGSHFSFWKSKESRRPEVAMDRLFQGDQMATNLASDGFEVVAFGQGFLSMAAPSKRFEELVIAGLIEHGANPVMRWMVSNAAAEIDAAGNVKPSKKKSTEKIDGVVATLMALGRAMTRQGKKPSVYKKRGAIFL